MVLCCGEALIDMVPVQSATGEPCFLPISGGSPYNVAVALARLSVPTAFLCPLSTDFFGERLILKLQREGVDVTLIRRVDKPTTLAFVQLENQRSRNTPSSSMTRRTAPSSSPTSRPGFPT